MNIIRKYFKIQKWSKEQCLIYIDLCDTWIKVGWENKKNEMVILRKWCKKRLKKIERKKV